MQKVIFYHYVNEFGTYLFIPQGFYCLFWRKIENTVTLPHSAQRKHAFLGKTKETPKTKKLPSRKKIAL